MGRSALLDAEAITDSIANPALFTVVFDRYVVDVTRFIARNASPPYVEDLAIETFTEAFKTRTRFDIERVSARPWLFGIANNVLRHHYRSLAREQALLRKSAQSFVTEWSTTADTASVDSRVDASTSEADLARALAELSPEFREPLLLHVLADFTYAEVAEALGVALGTVRSRISRAKERLRDLLATTDSITSADFMACKEGNDG